VGVRPCENLNPQAEACATKKIMPQAKADDSHP
jgi:hypothetical protein